MVIGCSREPVPKPLFGPLFSGTIITSLLVLKPPSATLPRDTYIYIYIYMYMYIRLLYGIILEGVIARGRGLRPKPYTQVSIVLPSGEVVAELSVTCSDCC